MNAIASYIHPVGNTMRKKKFIVMYIETVKIALITLYCPLQVNRNIITKTATTIIIRTKAFSGFSGSSKTVTP